MAATNQNIRQIAQVVTAHRQTEGAGFIVRRPFPSATLPLLDPFLLIDEMGPRDYAPGEAIGAPDHPHRGFETVTYVLDGEFEHADSAGHRGKLRAGDVQWMTAGAGIVHSEMPSHRILREGGRVHGFQIWVNLPARAKMTRPRYQELAADRIPSVTSPDGLAHGRIIAGEAFGTRAAIGTHTPIVYQDWSLRAGAELSLPLPSDHSAVVYVFSGSVRVGSDGRVLKDGQLGVLGPGDTVQLSAAKSEADGAEPDNSAAGGGRLLLLAGVPLNEPVARYGPFVMNQPQEILQAFDDYRSGRMGEITRSALTS